MSHVHIIGRALRVLRFSRKKKFSGHGTFVLSIIVMTLNFGPNWARIQIDGPKDVLKNRVVRADVFMPM